ncbi:uncharacterized protein EV420DRAFT_1520269, partial [Desarmillaria tabescens]
MGSFPKDLTCAVVLGCCPLVVSFAKDLTSSLFFEGACLFRRSWFPGPCLLCSPDACVSFLQFVALCSLVDESYAPIVLDIFSLLLT